MSDNEEELRKKEQERALDVYRPSGAVMIPEYLERRQEVVAVNRDDLEDILGFDGMAASFGAIGMFFLSGATWLLIDHLATAETYTPGLIGICVVSIAAGGGFLAGGAFAHSKKRGRITRIYNQTKPLSAPPVIG